MASESSSTRSGVFLVATLAAVLAAVAFFGVGEAPGSSTQPPTTLIATTWPSNPSTTTGATRPPTPVPIHVDAAGFNDHTVPAIATVPEFFALARGGVAGESAVKFTIAAMETDPEIGWMDGDFYSLHDEWYWYRLLNGFAVPGVATVPHRGLRFATVDAIYAWAAAQPPGLLPFGLTFVGGQPEGDRLYSAEFYRLSLDDPRVFGLGSLAYFPTSADEGGERWVIELEYQDDPEPSEIETFFEMVASSVPDEIGANLEWVIRSPAQAVVAQTMAAGRLPYHDRVLTYSDLVEAGTVAVYNEGIAAGRLLLIGDGGSRLSDAREDDILLVETVPDYLPPGRALISSAPQTPLAHVNLLARNRGIPNASQAGVLQDPAIRQAARARAHAIVRASASDGLEVVLITPAQYEAWVDLHERSPVAVPSASLGPEDVVWSLEDLAATITDDADIGGLRPAIGGKAAGFLNLIATPGVPVPDGALVITVGPYFEHMATLDGQLDAILADPEFAGSARIRYLMLEGPAAFAGSYPAPQDRAFAERYGARHPAGSVIGDVLRSGGLKALVRSSPIDAAVLAAIRAALVGQHGRLHPSQGLRFRSSSTVEDIEGFNGAGLYESNTGFLHPELQVVEKDRKKSVEWAIKATWASYWGFEAFEERNRENVEHRSGGMAVVVHPRFDDDHELANGVATFTILPDEDSDAAAMVLNVQSGAVSVANPDQALGALPEVILVHRGRSGALRIQRLSSSNLLEAGEQVFSDSQVTELFSHMAAVAGLWKERVNRSLPEAQRIGTLTLDFEFKHVAAGWPHESRRSGIEAPPSRLVIKQARSLEPGLRGSTASVRRLPIPQDVLSRARLVERVTCPTVDGATYVALEVLTDPLSPPDVGYSENPMVIEVEPGDVIGGAGCTRTALFTTLDQYLYRVLEGGDLLNLSR